MSIEIERKFLLKSAPDSIQNLKPERIEQGYIAVESGGKEVRIRRKGERYFLAVKSGTGLVRMEIEPEITQAQFVQLWPATEGRRIEKDRFVLKSGEYLVEIDVYSGELSGLVVAEVEFSSVKAANAFVKPDWFGPEISQEAKLRNNVLALGVKFGDIKPLIDKLLGE